MDFSFSGLSTAATDALSHSSLEDVCYSFQENAFSMLVEVTERALAHTGKTEVLLAGGVGANMRLREMLAVMCDDRDASFYVPEKRYMGDNGAMIAYTGLLMFNSGSHMEVEASHVDPNFRPDTVDVTWMKEDEMTLPGSSKVLPGSSKVLTDGAEASLYFKKGYVVKERIPKRYRIRELDEKIRKERTRAEARLLSEARRCAVPTPIIHDIYDFTIEMEYIDGVALKHVIDNDWCYLVGKNIGRLHGCGIIHGDLTTSNMIVSGEKVYLIDFGLAYVDSSIESRGVDLHVLFQNLESTHMGHETLIESFCRGYRSVINGAEDVFTRVKEIEKRGRYA
jgi:N6-L-threonylcarbamoyladenine synthase/protein kinase Bud32